MKLFFISLILALNLQSWTNADEIKDFEIEGMSIGDSLLDYFSLTQITNKQNSYEDRGYMYKSKKYFFLTFEIDKINNFEEIQVAIKDNDKDYLIQHLSGLTSIDINECYSKFGEIEKTLDDLFKDTQKTNKQKRKHAFDDSGKSTTTDVYYYLKNGSYAALVCVDWSDEIYNKYRWEDTLRLEMGSANFTKWFDNLAY